jgi:hypothetical protein
MGKGALMTTALYELGLAGSITADQAKEIETHVSDGITPFGFTLGKEVAWSVNDIANFNPPKRIGAAIAFIGAQNIPTSGLANLLRKGIPVIPVATNFNNVSKEIPESLRKLNCISYQDEGAQRIATALLECAGLLPRQRRVFLSYRRTESRAAALQLFSELSGRRFDVFLDTHDVAPAENFQAMLWHRLCDADVLIMLDTQTYFESRWTKAEFGRAQLKGISILRVGWPGVSASPRAATASQVLLDATDIAPTGHLSGTAISSICSKIELLRSQSLAVRQRGIFDNIHLGVNKAGGKLSAIGQQSVALVTLSDGKEVFLYPSVGIPTAVTLNEAANHSPDSEVAIVYDELGIHEDWLRHISWLNSQIKSGRYIQAHKVGWAMTDWEDKQ